MRPLVVGMAVALAGCGGGVASLSIDADTQLFIADGHSHPTLLVSAFDRDGKRIDHPENLTTLVDGAPAVSGELSTTVAGTYSVQVTSGTVSSNVLTVTARPDKQYPLVTIPIVFHTVSMGQAVGEGANLSATQVEGLLVGINRAYSNQGGSTDPNAVDTRVRFRLAKISPDGGLLTEPGIDRVDGLPYDVGGGSDADVPADGELGPNEIYQAEGATFWNPRQYLNVWLVVDHDMRGAAISPWMYSDSPLPGLDTVPVGCVCDPVPFSNTPSLFIDYRHRPEGVAHEIGHALGLLHPFSGSSCSDDPDFASDTYNYNYDSVSLEPCPGNLGFRLIDNYMDYRGLFDTFTFDQRERIQAVLRSGLWQNELPYSTR